MLYTSNPNAPGGPVLRSAPGQAFFAGQQLRQTIELPDIFQNEVAFKTLGLFPGTAVQEGRWQAVDGNRYVVCTSTNHDTCTSLSSTKTTIEQYVECTRHYTMTKYILCASLCFSGSQSTSASVHHVGIPFVPLIRSILSRLP